MGKTDKELAVDLVISYIESWAQQTQQTGVSKPLFKYESVLRMVADTHETLKKLD
ncbi:hypothetical protein [Bacillus sp. FSL W8-0940]|uniref:hypothetical protein n=1 Tax=Bacillus sp. FSL W8-0940 TaxID=2954638 RepID=UPI0030F8ECEC